MRDTVAADVIETTFGAEKLMLLPERAVWWEREQTLFVADLHMGKAAAFRQQSVYVPEGTSDDTLARLGALVDVLGARRLVVLGDLWHHRLGRDATRLEKLTSWRADRPSLEFNLVRGNHDRKSGRMEDEGFSVAEEPCAWGPFTLRHEPTKTGDEWALSGHLHPAVRLTGPGRQSLKLPAFWQRGRELVLPAFGSFTGCAVVTPSAGDVVHVIADGAVRRVL